MRGGGWQVVRELVEAACDLGAADRADFLARACGDDATLRAEVESILAAEGAAPGLLDAPAVEAFPDVFLAGEGDSMVGRTIGAWRLVRFVRAGGMGWVFVGERADGQFAKVAAVKLIKRRLLSADTVRRFRLERQVLASFDHANIARLLDGGVSEDGLPYLVMEYVEGLPIDRYCDERRLSTDERLALFLKVGAAVRYAHRNLIVHRDLKPGNILVTPEGEPKLLDFGIAKVLEPCRPNGEAETTHRVLTPEYASPEHIRGEAITTASDVYSLGVILFELLTGHRPYRFRGRLPHEIERTICEEEPERPSTAYRTTEPVGAARDVASAALRRRLSGDLDEIILKALRKEPERRYETVDRLCDDIVRHLEGLPVAARRGTLRYRGTRFVRRHRAAVGAGLLIALALVAGVVAALSQKARVEEEALKLREVNAFLEEVLASVDVQGTPDRPATVRAILDEAARRIDHGVLDRQPLVEAEVRITIGMAYLELGEHDLAAGHFAAALAARVAHFGDDDPAAAECLNALGRAAKARGDYAEAERLYRRALEIRGRAPGPRSAEHAQTLNDLGVLLKTTGRLDEAAQGLRTALAVREALAAAGGSPQRVDAATTRVNLAAVLKNQGDLDGAEASYRAALETLRAELGGEHYRVAVAMNDLGLLLRERGAYERAEPLFREALQARRAALGDDHPAVATGLKNLALVLTEIGRYVEAEALYRDALERERREGVNPHLLANTLTNLADLLVTARAPETLAEAEALCREGLEIRRTADADHPRLASSLLVLGRVHLARDEPRAAEAPLREAIEAIEAQEARGAAGSRKVLPARIALGRSLARQARFDEAEPILLDCFERAGPGSAPAGMRRDAAAALVEMYEAWGRPEAAAEARSRASDRAPR